MKSFALAGSQRWLQVAVNRKPQLLLSALQRSGAVGPGPSITWHSPLEADDFREYRDGRALAKAGITDLKKPLEQFWPSRRPVWDALGTTPEVKDHALFIEAKAHISETASPATRASATSRELIERSLGEARRFYAPRATAIWSNLFYQYANRLAHQYFLRLVDPGNYSRNGLFCDGIPVLCGESERFVRRRRILNGSLFRVLLLRQEIPQ